MLDKNKRHCFFYKTHGLWVCSVEAGLPTSWKCGARPLPTALAPFLPPLSFGKWELLFPASLARGRGRW